MAVDQPQQQVPVGGRRVADVFALSAVLACLLSVSIALGMVGPLLNLLMNEAGVSRTVIGLNTTMFAVATLAIMPVLPGIVDRYGAPRFLIACLALSMVSALLFKLVPMPWGWFPVRFAMGVGLAGLWAASEAWINQLAEERWRGFIIGIYTTMHTLGFAVGAASLKLAGTQGWTPFVVASVLMGLACLPVFFTLGRQIEPPAEEAPSFNLFSYFRLAPFIMGGALVFGILDIGVFGMLPVYGVRTGLTAADGALLLVTASAANLLTQIPIGLLADRMDRRRLLVILTVIGLGTALLLPAASANAWTLHGLLVVMGASLFGLYTVSLVLLGQEFKGRALPAANAAFLFAYGLGCLGGPAFAGVAMDVWDPHGLAAVLVLSLIAYLGVATMLRTRAKAAG